MTPQEQREHNAKASVTIARMAILDHYEAHNNTKGMTQKAIALATGLTCHAVAEWRCKQRRERNFAPKAEVVHEVAAPERLIHVVGNRLFCYYREIMQLSSFDKSIILLIIYKSFAESFEEKVFSSVQITDLLAIALAVVLLFYFVFYLIGFVAKKMHFSLEDSITAQFCGTKKSLVHGTVFSKILFPASYPVGLVLLPLMLFHALQIFIISIIASKLAKRN